MVQFQRAVSRQARVQNLHDLHICQRNILTVLAKNAKRV
jgi:hypothetical protein